MATQPVMTSKTILRHVITLVSTSFEILDGLKHGDALSNFLFEIALEGAIGRSGIQRNGSIITQSHMLLGFVDDIDLIGIDCMAVEEAYTPLKREKARIGLTINPTKTKYMIAGRDRGRPGDVSTELVIDGDVFQVVEEFVYLGTLVACDNNFSFEVVRRIATANRAFYGLHNKLRSRNSLYIRR